MKPRSARQPRRHLLACALAAASLAACTPGSFLPSSSAPPASPRPAPRPDALADAPAAPPAEAAPAPAPPSARSAAARDYYAMVERKLLEQGLLRRDGGGRDTPYTDRMLAENFLRIALRDEYDRREGRFIQRDTAAILRRWAKPVRLELRFSPAVGEAQRAKDRKEVAAYAARLSRITGHPIALVESAGNFIVEIVTEDERAALAPRLARDFPELSAEDIRGITEMPPTIYCLVYAAFDGRSGTHQRALAVIRAEHPDLLRLSCLHEEIAQGLGLANDSPRARPSIFNDDEEFALLTSMDELMLKMLYDPALRPGMTEEEARPIVETLAREWLPGS